MHLPPSVHVVLGPSRIIGAGIGIATLATLVIVLLLPFAPWQHALSCGLVLAWSYAAFRYAAVRRASDAINEMRLAPDLVLVVHRNDGQLVAGHVRSSTYVSSWLTSVVWRPDGARFSRACLIVPDMLPEDDFRRLRVMLRYARSALQQEEPLSQS
jgi:hypothetical protein